MLQRVSPSLTTYQPGSSTAVPAVSQLRERVATRLRLSCVGAPTAGALPASARLARASFLSSRVFPALPASALERTGDGPCAFWSCGPTSLLAILVAASSAARR